MIKRTLYFGNPAYLSKKNDQLIIKLPEDKNNTDQELEVNPNQKYLDRGNVNSIPIEDIGVIILDNQQITVSQGLLSSLLENNTAIVTCNFSHLPIGLFLPLESNLVQSERFQSQIEASEPLKKQLWQQTITAKIYNQAAVLRNHKKPNDNMKRWAKDVRSGDADNLEGRAASYYWKTVFPPELEFKRDRDGQPPNNLLNYGYAILRAVVARGLVASGLLPTLGIHHHNKYNAYCLADDIMEPYRPYVDDFVVTFVEDGEDFTELTPSIKKQLLTIPALDIFIDGEKSPLMVGMQKTTSSLVKCFNGEAKKIIYPTMFN
ncbi:MAG: subtype II CRISPR-associated endonuclease Cas1 [Ignavibacteriales bacterium UTCHB2]|jgi:CRISPR-associated protein Cas1|nr:MAG: CRISPR-associated endonuclease Cas1 [Ignavibacteria bacterium ADurb.Bin266]OQY71228.1 MAG: subtype II CRISPR-associated endonuclease Cas1 [Ignavibacteriales bacterium UTCHB2]HQJ45204.1 type II CRISPR-associated endonuclease Cas1 [Ignavibacteriaceae bacterium]